MRLHRLFAGAALGAIALAACGSGSGGGYGSSAASPAPTTSAPAAARMVAVKTGTTALGPVLVDNTGRTLYGDTADMNGTPSCVGACASVWPPVIVNGTTVPSGLDTKIFSVVARPDGTDQLVAGKWPLYRFAGDTNPGDTNGQGSEGFFVATPSGGLNKGG
jgi:predicted lipoprotein with Yx(FWY)xxD motif